MASDDASSETTTETVVRTVILPLETSHKKTALVASGIDEFQEMASYFADVLVSFPPNQWRSPHPTHYRVVVREFDADRRTVKATVARDVVTHVAAAFRSWHARGMPGERPQFGGGDYLYLSNQEIDIVANNRGYGLKTSFIPYSPVWFHIATGAYQTEFLERITEGDAEAGAAELHLADDGSLTCHLAVKWDVDVYEPTTVSRALGVDIGERVIYAAGVVDGETVEAVEMETGQEFRHHRTRLTAKRDRAMAAGDLRAAKQCRGERARYTEHVTHTASRAIVDLAVEYAPITIALEDLTNYRKTADNPIHDWPFGMLQEQIMYKATGEGIPVVKVNPRNTSITCRKCGQATEEFRNGDDFHCRRCGYEVHADVNAALNIAQYVVDE